MTARKAGGGREAVSGYKNRASVCIDCGNGGGRCPWSSRMEPVPGWTVEKVTLRMQKSGKSYYEEVTKVIDCPGYHRRQRKGGGVDG